MIQRRVFVEGRVQGVGFRASALRAAVRFGGLRGYVRNLPDGGVEAVFCGDAIAVESMVAWCRKGPPLARVLSCTMNEEACDAALPPFRIA